MTVQTVTLNLPSVLYDRLKRRADQAHRSIETELIEAVAMTVPSGAELPDDLVEQVSSLTLLDEKTLRRAAQSHFSAEKAAELEALHLKRQDEGLTEKETQQAGELTSQYERAMVLRAQAIALLLQRGYDVSGLLVAEPK